MRIEKLVQAERWLATKDEQEKGGKVVTKRMKDTPSHYLHTLSSFCRKLQTHHSPVPSPLVGSKANQSILKATLTLNAPFRVRDTNPSSEMCFTLACVFTFSVFLDRNRKRAAGSYLHQFGWTVSPPAPPVVSVQLLGFICRSASVDRSETLTLTN